MDRTERYVITPETLLRAYAAGVFPMAETRDAKDLFWVDPELRGIIPLDGLHISKSMKKTLRKEPFLVTCDTAYHQVMYKCAEQTEEREDTWMNEDVFRLYGELFELGCAHSIECWEDNELVGGLYGVCLGSAFFGESMFSRRPSASKVALIHLVARLRLSQYTLLDTQFVTDHLATMGALEIPRSDYHDRLDRSLQDTHVTFYCDPTSDELSSEISAISMQSKTQMS